MIHDEEIDEVAIDEVEDEREPVGFELDALLIERAAAEAAELEEERHNTFLDRVRDWAYDDGSGNGVEVPGKLIMAGRDAIDEYFAGCYRTAHSPPADGDEMVAPPLPPERPKTTAQPTVRSAQGVRPLGLPRRPPPPELPPEPGYKRPIWTPGGFAARAARLPTRPPAPVIYEYRCEYRQDEDGRMRCIRRWYERQHGPRGLPEMPPSDRWKHR